MSVNYGFQLSGSAGQEQCLCGKLGEGKRDSRFEVREHTHLYVEVAPALAFGFPELPAKSG